MLIKLLVETYTITMSRNIYTTMRAKCIHVAAADFLPQPDASSAVRL